MPHCSAQLQIPAVHICIDTSAKYQVLRNWPRMISVKTGEFISDKLNYRNIKGRAEMLREIDLIPHIASFVPSPPFLLTVNSNATKLKLIPWKTSLGEGIFLIPLHICMYDISKAFLSPPLFFLVSPFVKHCHTFLHEANLLLNLQLKTDPSF